MPEVKAKVTSISSSGDKVKIGFKLVNASKFLGLMPHTAELVFDTNPGWDKGDEVTISISKV